MGYRLVEIVYKQIIDSQYELIAECNEYDDDDDKLSQQFSRSPFTFSTSMSDTEIIDSIKINEYSIYF